MLRSATWSVLLVLACGLSAKAESPVEYNRDIRPILFDNCFACHGPDSASRKAGLRLDRQADAAEMGAIVPGKPDESELVRRILSTDESEIMPPPKSHKKLTAAQKDLLKRWVTAGAEYQPHWSLIAPQRPKTPAVKNAAWVRNGFDPFVLAKLESLDLEPAPEADRRTLARRVSLDLRGVPPTPAEVDSFVNDTAPDAYEQYVDRMLNSKHWGEHRGRYWLDAARYADTHGIHFDNYREIWAYRDWVIGAFNRNLPFDQFTVEQLAGDLLPNKTLDQQVASGFNRCNITTNEGGVIAEEYLVLYTRDRTETVSQVWLGLTTGCAVCHDHKFDPLTQREFYELAAIFNNTTQGAMDGNIKDTPPTLFVPAAEDRPVWEKLSKDMGAVQSQIASRKQSGQPEFQAWLAGITPESVAALEPKDGLRLQAKLDESKGKTVTVNVDGQPREITLEKGIGWAPGPSAGKKAFSLEAEGTCEIAEAGDFEADKGFAVSAWVKIPRRNSGGAIVARMDNTQAFRGWDLWVEGDKVGMHIINAWPGNALKVVGQQQLQPKEWYHVTVTYDGSKKAAGVKVYLNGQPQPVDVQADKLTDTIRTTVPFKIGQRHTSERLQALHLQDLRLYERALSAGEAKQLHAGDKLLALISKPAAERSDAEKNELLDWWLAQIDPVSKDLNVQLAALQQNEAQLKGRGTIAHVMNEKSEEAMAYILFRGEYDKRKDPVKAGTPSMLPPMPAELPRNRFGLAQWLLRPDHPLTARVTVNRFWQEVFGTGLVRTSGDFGVAGELPSNQELLDWLAVEFRETGWDVKRFFRMLVTSATYRQSAVATQLKLEKDPQNRFFSRGPRFRMDAEMVRDYALAASGMLSAKVGGPSVKPYQPEGVWEAVAMIGSNTRDYKADSGESLYRRSMYTFWKRSAPPASMDIFNAPSRETCTVRRERTNTPLQALVTLNDPQFVEAAKKLAEATLRDGGTTIESRSDYLARRILCRPLRPEEQLVVTASLGDLRAWYDANVADAQKLLSVGESKVDASMQTSELAAWTMLGNELLNLDEALVK